MEELRQWIKAAQAVQSTCQNKDVFDELIAHQKWRLAGLERLSAGFGTSSSEPQYLGQLPEWPGARRKCRTPEEAEIDRQLKKQQEAEDVDRFIPAYERATGLTLTIEEEAEDPDFIAQRSDGVQVGIELTAVTQGPVDNFYRPILTGKPEWDPNDALDQACFLVEQKAEKVPGYRTKSNILVLLNLESDFRLLCALAKDVPVEDLASAGFVEIWLADYTGVRRGMHQEVELFGLYPEKHRTIAERSDHDSKTYR